MIDPVYPKEALKDKASGIVVLDAVTGADGAAEEIAVVGSPNEHLSKAAEEALRRCTLKPARDRNGGVIEVCF